MIQPQRIEASSSIASLSLAATAVSLDLEAKAGDGSTSRPRFEIVGYTGAPMNVMGFYSPVILDLSGLRAASQEIPALRDHDTSRIVGQTDSVKIGTDVRLSGIITGENSDATEVRSQSKNGFKWQASIGADIVRREFLDAGKRATVNGREITGPMLIAREALLKEISFVALGADGQTSASVAASTSTSTLSGVNDVNFDQWVQAKGFDPAALSDVQRASLRAAYDAEQAAKTTPATPAPVAASASTSTSTGSTLDQILAAQKAENERVDKITRITASAIAERPLMLDEFERLSRNAIEAKSTPAEFELAVLRIRAAAPGTITRSSDSKMTAKVVEAAICLAGRLPDIEKRFDEGTLEAADNRFRHGLGLQELLLMAARENGYGGHSASDVRGVLRAAFSPVDVRADGGFSTLSLSGILSNVANKFLNMGFLAVESGWRSISAFRNVRDFKAVTSYSLSGDMTYEQVGPGGELKHGGLGETSYSNQALTYGRMFGITRQDIINDDLGALTSVPTRLGRGAALKINDVFWTKFLAGVGSFWTSGNSNLISGGTSVLASAGLVLALTKFRKQTDPDGKPLGVSPKFLLVPPELETTASELMTSTRVNTGGSSSTDRVPDANTWAGKYQIVQSSYLSNASYTGYSTTAWFLLADPADMPTIEVAFLNGRDTPIVESAEADFNTLGIAMRGYHDFGVALQEYRGSVRSAGA